VVTDADRIADADIAAVRDLAGRGVPVLRIDTRGDVVDRAST
jgi:hypothetical protein